MTLFNYSKNNLVKSAFLIFTLLFTFFASAQPTGSTCIDSNPFCTGSTYNFPNNPNIPGPASASSGNYGCLSSQPRPIWYHMKIDQGGTLRITMKQTTGPNGTGGSLDLDFALWGPFSDLASGCQQVANGQAPKQCSFSASSTENIGLGMSGGTGSGQSNPPQAQPGEYYIIVLTNYSQQSGYIDFNQTGGTASTDCLIVIPCPLTATITYPSVLCTVDTSTPVVQTGDLGGTFTSTPPGLSINATTGEINPSLSTPGPYTVTYEVIDSTDPTCFATSSAVLNVNTGGAPTFNQVAPICLGETFTLPTTATNGIVGTWSPAVNLSATTTYTFTPDPNQCGAVPVDMTVVVNPLPVVSAGPDSLICEGTMFTLNGSGATSYTWDNGVTNGVPFSPVDLNPVTYTVTGTSAQGCTNTDQMTLSITPLPIVSFTPDKVTGCIPLEVNFLDDNPSNNTYAWSFGNGQTATTGPLATTTFNSAGCFDVNLTLTTPNGCSNSTTYTSLICLNPLPVSSFNAIPNVLTQLDAYTNMNNTSVGGTMYEWNFGDGSPINTQFAPGHLFPSATAGSYEISLTVTSQDGCKHVSTAIIEVLDDLVYYVPNAFTPDEDEFNPTFKPVFTSGFEPLSYRMVIYNRWGELVFETLDLNYGWDGTYSQSEGHVQEGSYTWRIEFKTTLSDARKIIMGHVNVLR